MAKCILFNSGGAYSAPAEKPFSLQFSKAQDLEFPFSGTAIIIPKEVSEEQWEETLAKYPLHSIRFPWVATGIETKTMPWLRDMANQPVVINNSVYIVFIANDDVYNWDSVFVPWTGWNAVRQSSTPKYLVLELPDVVCPFTNLPAIITKTAATSLMDCLETDTNTKDLKAWFDGPGVNGILNAYDAAGMQIDAISALHVLEVDTGSVAVPAGCIVQWVNPHGDPVDIRDFYFAKFMRAEFNNSVADATPVNGALTIIAPASLWLTTWPHGKFEPHETGAGNMHEASFATEDGDAGKKAHFLRICAFEPYKEFQTTIPNEVEVPEEYFPKNRYRVFTQNNRVQVLNNGQDFFADLYEKGKELGDGDYFLLCNWRGHPHIPLRGNLQMYGVGYCNLGEDAVANTLRSFFDAAQSVRVHAGPVLRTDFISIPDVDEPDSLGIWNSLNTGAVINQFGDILESFNPDADHGYDLPLDDQYSEYKSQVQDILKAKQAQGNDQSPRVLFMPETASFSGRLETGGAKFYVREGQRCFPMVKNPFAGDFTVRATWKDDTLGAHTAVDDLTAVTPAANSFADTLPDNSNRILPEWFALGADMQDPPQAQLQRMVSEDTMRAALSIAPADDVLVLMINGNAGTFTQAPIATDFCVPPAMSVNDTLTVAIIVVPAGGVIALTAEQFRTTCTQYQFAAHQIASAQVAYRDDELGGLLRSRIAAGTQVKAMYWDQMLERLKPAGETESGDTNNQAIVHCINRVINSKSGMAALDRSSRAFSAFHQKTTVLIKKDPTGSLHTLTGYVGGIDLTAGRWDSSNHFPYDPERSGGVWHDVHVRLEGECVIDVVRNFKQRWDALRYFLQANVVTYTPTDYSPQMPESSVPVGLLKYDNLVELAEESNAFVQINRTIPPNCEHARMATPISALASDEDESYPYVTDQGEFGCRHSYFKAIANARRFIHIEDQYFWDTEIALALHNALKGPKGPAFLILVLPKNLNEFALIDNQLYKRRRLAVNILKYGATSRPVVNPSSDLLPADPADLNYCDVSAKICFVTPMTDKGKDVYVHAKHMIVDDVWMTIGSSNIGYRSMTYDFEIDAAIIGQEWYNGGSHLVRSQRLELWRLHLNLPSALIHTIQDPYAGFRLFKHIEGANTDIHTRGLAPYSVTRCMKFDPLYVPPAPPDSSVVVFDEGTPAFFWLMNNVFDPDGRVAIENTFFKNLVKYPPVAFIGATLMLANTSNWMLNAAQEVTSATAVYRLKISVVFADTEEYSADPIDFCTLGIEASGTAPNLSVVITGDPNIFIPFEGHCTIHSVLQRQAAAATAEFVDVPNINGQREVLPFLWHTNVIFPINLITDIR